MELLKKEWLLTFLKLKNGIPSHDTIVKIFARIDANTFEKYFIAWMQSLVVLTQGQVIAINEKNIARFSIRHKW